MTDLPQHTGRRASAYPVAASPSWPLAQIVTFLAFLFLYALTTARDVLPADAGEYQLAIPQLKVLHPPGFSLYTLVGKLFVTVFPISTPAFRLNLLSAVLAAATLIILARTVQTLTGSALSGLLAAAALGVSTTFWSQATLANVRMPTALFAALCLYYLARLRQLWPIGHAPRDDAVPSVATRPLTLFALSLGLGLTHHLSLAFMGLVFGAYLLLLDPTLLRPSRRWIAPAIALFAPMVVWIYFPLREARFRTLAGLFEHVSARGFEGDFFYFAHLAQLPDRLAILGNILAFQFNPVLLALIGLSLALMFWRDWRLCFLLAAAFGLFAFVAITYRAPQTVEYLLPAYYILALTLGVGLQIAAVSFPRLLFATRNSQLAIRNSQFVIGHLPFFIASLFTAPLFLRNLPSYLALAHDTSTRDYAETLLSAAPPGSIILSNWHWVTPLWYLQQTEGQRPDVEVTYVFPQGAAYAQNWVDRINSELPRRPVLVTNYFPLEYSDTPYRFEPLGSAYVVRAGERTDLPPGFTLLNLGGEGVMLRGVRYLDGRPTSALDRLTLDLAWQAPGAGLINFFVHLNGDDGRLYGQADVSHTVHASGEVLVDRYQLVVNPDALPGDYTLTAGAYLPDGTRLAEYTVETVHLGPAEVAPPTARPTSRLGASPTLAGYDYDRSLDDSIRVYLHWRLGPIPDAASLWAAGSPFAVFELPTGPGYVSTFADLPVSVQDLAVVVGPQRPPSSLDWRTFFLGPPSPNDRYIPLGNAMVLTGVNVAQENADRYRVDLRFLSARPLTEDNIVKVDLTGQGYAWRVQSDSVPAGGAIPTLKWLRGSRISDRHRLTIPADAQPGLATFELAVYDHFTGQVLAILDSRLAALGPTVPLGSVTISDR